MALAQDADGGLHRAGGLLYHDPRSVSWLIQDRIVPPTAPRDARLSVDLSSQMPPVGNQGNQGSCVAWAVGYYHKTHQEWLEHGWDVSQAAHQVSPAYIYNQINGGGDYGAYFEDAQTILCDQGACSMQDFPYNQSDCTSWPSESAFSHGILWRSKAAYWIDVSNDAGVSRVKARLDSGFTTVLGIDVWGNFDNIQNYNYTYCASERTGSDRGGHGVTFVGYDDSKATSDGTGAFKMVNSWGTGWGLSGYWWMSYQAVKDYYLSQGAAYYVTDKIAYQPTLLARVQLMDSTRDKFGIRTGLGRTSASKWTKDFRQFYMGQQQRRSFPNTKLVFDMTEGDSWLVSGRTDSVFVRGIDNSSDGWAGRIDYSSAQYLPWGATGVSPDVPVTIPDYNVAAYARARILFGQDVGCTRIIAPSGALDSGASVTPACSTYNYGTTSASYPVRMKIGTGYNQTANVSNQAPGSRAYVTFPSWAAGPRGSIAVSCSTELSADTSHANDRQTGSVQVNVQDVGVTRIIVPTGALDSGAAVTPACSTYNSGTVTESYTVRMKIGTGYNQTASVSSQAPGARSYVTFPSWAASPRGSNAVSCSTELATDANRANDRQSGSVQVNVHDVGGTKFIAPTGAIDSGMSVTPACSLYNSGTGTESYSARMRIGSFYNQTASVSSHGAGTRIYVTFPTWSVQQSPGTYTVRCSTELATDQVSANNRTTDSVQVQQPGTHDVSCTLIIAPAGTIDSATALAPACSVYNSGNRSETYNVRMRIGTGYNQTASVSSQAPGARTYVTFPSWTPGPRGSVAVSCSTELATDANLANDRQTGSVQVNVHDVACSHLLAPVGTVDSGSSVVPACSTYNSGTVSESYTVRMRVGSFYDQTASVSSHGAGTRIYITFPTWSVQQSPGTYTVCCSTELAADANPANDPQTGNVTVVVHDVGAIAIITPAGGIDSGTVVTPQAVVQNSGTASEDFQVRLLIEPAYVDSQTVNLAAGAVDTVSFADWIAGPLGLLALKCTTLLTGDLNPANDFVQDSVLVSPFTDMEKGQPDLPRAFVLEGPKPNPFAQQTMICYGLPHRSHVALGLYSVTGKLLKTLVNRSQPPGYYSLLATDYLLPEGIYLLRAELGDVSFTRKLVKIQ
jgi:hypothetical protein